MFGVVCQVEFSECVVGFSCLERYALSEKRINATRRDLGFEKK
ncbi:hypothetical protein GVAMD_0451 [Gardnerella vaginalis AMD]|nr:hypothetical protein GVAMD_0451 [Gardnerella vaginalis AMD]